MGVRCGWGALRRCRTGPAPGISTRCWSDATGQPIASAVSPWEAVAEISIGRLTENTIELPGQKVSRRHAKLVRVDFGPSRWTLVDVGSSGGVFVNEQRIKEHELAPGDRIVIGEYTFEYALASRRPPAATNCQRCRRRWHCSRRHCRVCRRRCRGCRRRWRHFRRRRVATGGRGFWTTRRIVAACAVGGVVLLMAVAAAVIWPSISAARATAQSVLCANQLRQIGLACEQYERQFASYPPTLGDLAGRGGVSATTFICPADAASAAQAPTGRAELRTWINENTGYTYTGRTLPGGIVAYENAGQHGDQPVNVLLADGSVHRLAEADLKTRLSMRAQASAQPASPVAPGERAVAPPAPRSPRTASPTISPPRQAAASLAEARKGFATKLTRQVATADPVEQPPANVFRIVKYDAPPGKLAAYLTPDPGDGAKHPAIVWITGGDCNSIGDVWSEADPDDDQTAAAYRKAGIVMMFPSLRGGNGNPGHKEGFYGEVDDILAAADYLAAQPYVDPARIYLGGHSTGGTLALLVAECSERFRAVFSFGPAGDVTGYDDETVALPFDRRQAREVQLRAPAMWLEGIKTPTFLFEGNEQPGNRDSLNQMALAPKSPNVRFFAVKGKNHFSILAPTNQLIAAKINRDTGPATNLSFTAGELTGLTSVGQATIAPPAPVKPTGVPRPIVTPGKNWSAVIGTQEGGYGEFTYRAPERMVGIRYVLTEGNGPVVLRSVSAVSSKPLSIGGTEKTVQARDGYMVYGLIVDADKYVNALRVVFVRVQGERLVPEDTYMSDWLGTPQTDKPTTLGSNGRRVMGLVFYARSRLNAIAITFEP